MAYHVLRETVGFEAVFTRVVRDRHDDEAVVAPDMVHRSALVDRELAGRGAVEAHVDGERTLIHGLTKCRSDRGRVPAAFVHRGSWGVEDGRSDFQQFG